ADVEPGVHRLAVDLDDRRADGQAVFYAGGGAVLDGGGDDRGLVLKTRGDAHAHPVVVVLVLGVDLDWLDAIIDGDFLAVAKDDEIELLIIFPRLANGLDEAGHRNIGGRFA